MTPQMKTLLEHLQKHESISQAEATLLYKMRALPRRISDLKEVGVQIRRELRVDPTGSRYARYFLEAPTLVGKRIRIVRPWVNDGYDKGDEGVVVRHEDREIGPDVDFDNGKRGVYISLDEFEVIA